MSSFSKMANKTASTKRAPAFVSGKRGEAAAYLTGLKCLPLDPVDANTARRLNLATAFTMKQTFLEGSPDIINGDLFVVGAKTYSVNTAEDWEWLDGDIYLHLVLESPQA